MKSRQRGHSNLHLAVIFIASVSLSMLLFNHLHEPPIRYGPGVLVTETPIQGSANTAAVYRIKDFEITPIASFNIRARVLHTKTYDNDTESVMSPIDLALGWGRMSDQSVIDQLKISQDYRWYRWRYENTPPIPVDEIVASSANMHMIPADTTIKDKLMAVREGDIVRITGYLVTVKGPNGYYWNSSTTRDDAGNGSCEVIWVKSIAIEN